MAQQTSVEWLFETMAKTPITEWYNVLQQAKEMEYNQIVNAYLQSRPKGNIVKCLKTWDNADEYYNKTYKNDKQTTL
jgi:hypothetical protein